MPEAGTIAFHTLGCKLNFSETATLSRMAVQDGFVTREFDDLADVYVINTCSVTENADKECRYLLRQIQRKAPESFVVITGCYAQLKPAEIAAIPGVSLVLGAAEKFNLTKHVRELVRGDSSLVASCDIDQVADFRPSYSTMGRTRSFLKLQDGCDYSCSFCTIPLARGKSRSGRISEAVEQVRHLAAGGVLETVLTGVNLGDFGYSDHENSGHTKVESFEELVKTLDAMPEMPRYRISSIEPNLLTDGIIETVALGNRFMPHFHLPLQSGSNRMLGLMRRRYRRELYSEKAATIIRQIPHASIGADVIVGFPGETDADFQETVDFIGTLPLAYLHVFTYSERADTTALAMKPVVPVPVRNDRNKRLRSLSYSMAQNFAARHAGQTRPVLFERNREKMIMEGFTDNYIRISASYREEWVNRIIDWTL